MSVAFRRESDDEHLEPKFELPIPLGPNLVTARGLGLIGKMVAKIEARIAELESVEAQEAAITSAKRDLRYWQTRQVTAELMPKPSGEQVEFGTTVTFRMAGRQRVLGIVGHDEADPAAGFIAFSAPLARALMGAVAGDLVEFAGKDDGIEVLAIATGTAASD